MHSIREVCGTDDSYYSFLLFTKFFSELTAIDEKLKVDF